MRRVRLGSPAGSGGSRGRGIRGWFLVLCWLSPALGGAEPAASDQAMVLEAGSVAHRRLVALGEDLTIWGSARGGVTVLQGSLRVEGEVEGPVTVLGGDLVLASRGRIRGEVVVAGGRLRLEPGARLEGTSVVYPTVSRSWLLLLEGPAVGLGPLSPWVLGVKLGLTVAWLAWTLLLTAFFARPLQASAAEIAGHPFLDFLVGITAVTCSLLLGLLVSALVPQILAAPILGLLLLLLLLAKLWGMSSLFLTLGSAWARWRGWRLGALDLATLGCLMLALVRLVPYLGLWVWSGLSVVGIGASIRSLLGSRELGWQATPGEPGAARLFVP